jgi:hypothetical protein
MNAHVQNRGGAPVGYLSDLSPAEEYAVLCLRLWCDDARARVRADFTTAFGVAGAGKLLESFERLYDLCARHGRRPLIRHHVACKFLGADESCFVTFIGYACDGDRDDALLIATTLVRPDVAPLLVALAQDFGLALRRMLLGAGSRVSDPQILH